MKRSTKILANIIKSLMTKLVGEEQSSISIGRQGVDNIVIVQEIIHTMQIKTGKSGLMAVKLVLEEVYDSIDWGFLWVVMQIVGMEEKFIDVIIL